MVATGNLLDLEEVSKAPLSTVTTNTNNMDETLRPQVLGTSSVVWVSSSVAWAWFWDPVLARSLNKPEVGSHTQALTLKNGPLERPDPAHQALGGVAEQCPL